TFLTFLVLFCCICKDANAAHSSYGSLGLNSPATVFTPYFDYTNLPPAQTPANGAVFEIHPGQNINFLVTGKEDNPAGALDILVAWLPAGSTFSSQVGINPGQRTFDWTPTSAQLGSYFLSFDLVDNAGIHAAAPTSVIVSVT